jgi:hypothetical protein
MVIDTSEIPETIRDGAADLDEHGCHAFAAAARC